ncbi:unnamed protein product [Rotaria sordida]|uniref:Intraflagellar transport protein 88 homolog n=1 Tax=Rotaria sordida TaxID=392033 RepID=A0A818S580_9BILA|nr:unnamed protein product [Rotaria sordida]CAF3666725.1 unnamed protein product [Rotaria sordida]
MTDKPDSYSGFNEYNPLLDTDSLKYDTDLQQAVLKTSHGRRAPPTGLAGAGTAQKGGFFSRMKNIFGRQKTTAVPPPGTSSGRLGTASRAAQQQNSVIGAPPGSASRRLQTGSATGQRRPTTAVQGAGFTTGALGSGATTLGPSQFERKEETNEDKAKKLERTVLDLVEESCLAYEKNDTKLALEKSEEAMRNEKSLNRYREEQNLGESDLNLTGFVILHCANMLAKCGMNSEAMNQYNLILKNKLLPVPSRLRINIGNIFLRSKQYTKALKMYRMALDQIPEQNADLKFKVRENIAATHILMTQYAEAAQAYESIMQERPNYRSGLNLLLCYHTLGQRDKTRRAFSDLLKIPFLSSDDDYQASVDKADKHANLVLEATRDDRLRQFERKRRRFAEHVIVTAAKIVGNNSDGDFVGGYEWCIEQVRNSTYLELASGLEIQKAIAYLREDNFPKAISTLKEFEKAEAKLASAASTNLSFLYFLEKDLNNAHKYADLALKTDKFNPASLTNKGNCCYAQEDYDKARYYYEEALNIDAGSVEALHNLILTLMKSKQYQRVKDLLHKYTIIQPTNAQVFCLMAEVLEHTNDIDNAKSWYLQALSTHRMDGHLHRRIGEVIDVQGDKSDAIQYYFDAFRHNPCDIKTLEWLASYYIETQYPEKAVEFCAQAALVKPGEIKWHLMVASCYRRTGDYTAALEKYKWIHQHFPDDTDCIQFLVKISTDLGLPEREMYENELKKVNKMKEIQLQRKTSADKSRNIVKGRKISQAENDGSHSKHDDNRQLSGRKRAPIDLDHTEGVFSQQEPVAVPSFVNQLSQDMTGGRPRTAILKKDQNKSLFDENDDAAELLP